MRLLFLLLRFFQRPFGQGCIARFDTGSAGIDIFDDIKPGKRHKGKEPGDDRRNQNDIFIFSSHHGMLLIFANRIIPRFRDEKIINCYILKLHEVQKEKNASRGKSLFHGVCVGLFAVFVRGERARSVSEQRLRRLSMPPSSEMISLHPRIE